MRSSWFTSPLRTSLFLAIGESALTLVDLRRAAPAVIQAAWSARDADAMARCALQLGQLFQEADAQGARVRIVLADALVRYFTVTPPGNLADLRDCEAAVALRFGALFDDAPARWDIQADWHLTQPFLACALPRALKACIEDSARAAGLRLMGVAPQYVCAWNRWRARLAPDGWLVLAQGAQLTLGVAAGRRLAAVKGLASTGTFDQAMARLPGLLSREALARGQDAPGRVALIAPLAGQWTAPDGGAIAIERIDTPWTLDLSAPLQDGAALALAGGVS